MQTNLTANIIKKKRIHNLEFDYNVWGYALSIFLFSMPFFVWNTTLNVAPILLIFCLVFSLRYIKLTVNQVIPVILIILLYVVISIRGEFNIIGTAAILLICHLFLLDEKFLIKVFNAYLLIFSVTIIPSLIVYILVIFLGVQLPNIKIEALNHFKEGIYLRYPFLVVYLDAGIVIPRFFGYYDEPGVVGTIAGVLLCARNFNLKDKINIPIFIAGILSLSLFFIIICAIYVIVFAKLKYKIITVVLLFLFVINFFSNKVLNEFVFNRLEITPSGLTGDNRIGDIYFEEWYKKFQDSSSYLFGLGRGSHLIYNIGGCTYKDVITDYGILFFIIYITSFVFKGYQKIKKARYFFIYLLIFFGVIYQRPFIENLFYVFLLFAPISDLSNQRNKNLYSEHYKARRI